MENNIQFTWQVICGIIVSQLACVKIRKQKLIWCFLSCRPQVVRAAGTETEN